MLRAGGAEQADTRAQAAVDRVERIEQQTRGEREQLERALAEQRDRSQTAELAQARAQAALEAEQRLSAQLETDLQTATKRLEAAEKARDAAIASLEAAATRGSQPVRGRRTKDS